MKAQIRRWSSTENKNYFVDVEVVCGVSGLIRVKINGLTVVDGFGTVENALKAAEKLIRERKISNS
jgi:predicted DNA-binding WGR domain protein